MKETRLRAIADAATMVFPILLSAGYIGAGKSYDVVGGMAY